MASIRFAYFIKHYLKYITGIMNFHQRYVNPRPTHMTDTVFVEMKINIESTMN